MEFYRLSLMALMAFTTISVTVNASIIEQGDLNIIQQTGNASDGLRFLDMTYGDGKTSAAALTAAQAVYSNARLATASEWDDLFQAAGVTYSGTSTASDAFTTGSDVTIADSQTGTNDILAKLGATLGTLALIAWSDPDGSSSATGTRDYMAINNGASLFNAAITPAFHGAGWFIVSEASAASVPEPSSLAMLGLIGCAGIFRRRRRGALAS